MDNSWATIVSFFLLTFFFSILRFMLAGSTSEKIVTIAYFIIAIMMQHSVNIDKLRNKCGHVPHGSAIYFTILPWLFIFLLLYVCLIVFPGWKGPFSNTFGYSFASAMGVKSLLVDNILKDENELINDRDKTLLDVREDIFKSPELLINEITPDNFDLFWSKLRPLFRPDADEYQNSLRKIIHIKDIIADFVWFCLAGAFTISVSFNNIANVDCQPTAEEMEEKGDENMRRDNVDDNDRSNETVYVETD